MSRCKGRRMCRGCGVRRRIHPTQVQSSNKSNLICDTQKRVKGANDPPPPNQIKRIMLREVKKEEKIIYKEYLRTFAETASL